MFMLPASIIVLAIYLPHGIEQQSVRSGGGEGGLHWRGRGTPQWHKLRSEDIDFSLPLPFSRILQAAIEQ